MQPVALSTEPLCTRLGRREAGGQSPRMCRHGVETFHKCRAETVRTVHFCAVVDDDYGIQVRSAVAMVRLGI